MIKRKAIAFILARNIGCCLLFIFISALILTAKAEGTFSILHPGVQYGFFSGSIYSLLFIIIAIFCYMAFICLIGAKLAFDSHRYFSNVELRRVILYFLSVIPPIIVSQYLIRSHGPLAISIITAYCVFSFIINYALKHLVFPALPALYEKIKNKYLFIFINLVFESLLFLGVWFLMSKIKEKFGFPPPLNADDQWSFLSWYARVLFIIVFNCINYISVEYISSVFSFEMKKPHVKSYFLYNQSSFKRFRYIIRTTIPVILAKIRFYLAWFIGFILFYEMDNNIYNSIGARIGNQTDRDSINGVNIFSIFIWLYGLLCILNIIIDILISSFGSSDKDKEPLKFPQGQVNFSLPRRSWKKTSLRNKLLFLFTACFVLLFSIFAVCYSDLYTIIQHYDFRMCQKFDVLYVMDEIRFKFDDDTMADAIMNKKLCIKERHFCFTDYKITEFAVEQEDGRIQKIIPVTEAPEGNLDIDYPNLFFIVDNDNKLLPDAVDPLLIKSVDHRRVRVPKFFEDRYIPFSMERDHKGGQLPLSSYKLFWPILVYYIFYLFLTAAMVFLAVFAVYRIINKVRLSRIYYSRFSWIMGKLYEVVKLFIISTPFIILIAFSYLFFPDNQVTGLPTLAVFPSFTGSIFLNSIIVYLIFGLVLIIYTIPGIYDDGKTFTENILKSQELKYLVDIGLGKNEIGKFINKKYGNRRILQVFVENLLFVLVMQFFIMYCYSRSQFIDVIGIGSVMSIENIVSKVYRTQVEFTLIIAIQYIVLFIIYGLIYAVTKCFKGKS